MRRYTVKVTVVFGWWVVRILFAAAIIVPIYISMVGSF
jgi:hypothetical protein